MRFSFGASSSSSKPLSLSPPPPPPPPLPKWSALGVLNNTITLLCFPSPEVGLFSPPRFVLCSGVWRLRILLEALYYRMENLPSSKCLDFSDSSSSSSSFSRSPCCCCCCVWKKILLYENLLWVGFRNWLHQVCYCFPSHPRPETRFFELISFVFHWLTWVSLFAIHTCQ